MTDPTNEERLAELQQRYDREMAYYGKWADGSFKRYKLWNTVSIVLSAAVPIVALMPAFWGGDAKNAWVVAVAGIFGAVATFCRTIDGFQKNQQQWMNASHLLAKLRGEKLLFETRSGQYADKNVDAIALFVTTFESLIQNEGESWWQQVKERQAADAGGKGTAN